MDKYRLIFALIFNFGYLISTILPGISADNENNIKDNEKGYYTVPRILNTFGEGAPVYGLYRRKDNLYVARDSTPHVEIYNVYGRNEWKENLTVAGMQGPYDLVGGEVSRSLFILDWFDSANVTTVSTKSQNQVSRFPIGEPFTVSALAAINGSSDSDVIVTCSQTMKIKEFTKSGELIRQVNILPEFTQPRHSIKLSSGQGYAVCHGYGGGNEQHRVCLLNNAGGKLDCFGNKAGNGKTNLDVCSRIAEDDDGNIIVADRNNKRVIVLSNNNNKLKFIQELVREREGLDGPTRILIDHQVLYVADNTVNSDGLAVSGKIRVFRVKDGGSKY